MSWEKFWPFSKNEEIILNNDEVQRAKIVLKELNKFEFFLIR